MSRNIGQTNCYFCEHAVVLVEAPRPISANEYAPYDQFVGMTVANAECPACLALYLAWVRPSQAMDEARLGHRELRGTHFDLSFRHSFNDEPSDRDLPRYEVKTQHVRVGPWQRPEYLSLGPVAEPEPAKES